MSKVAILRWRWQPIAPLVTGYSQNLAEAAGKIERGERQVVNLETHNPQGKLAPSFLATSVKGVFRSAAGWLIEREARQQGATTYVTQDYQEAIPERWRRELRIAESPVLCPLSKVFGGADLPAEDRSAATWRQKSLINFNFNRGNDAAYGNVKVGPPYRFTWEQIENKGKPLRIEQLTFAEDTVLEARIEPADDFAIVLTLLAGDLISSGFFRFGRFTSRGYGVVRLPLHSYFWGDLFTLLSQDEVAFETVPEGESGFELAARLFDGGVMQVIHNKLSIESV